MESKFYIPRLKEFYNGFEYEVMIPEKQVWSKETFYLNKSHIDLVQYVDIQDEFVKNKIRVKYLDSSDIESLGFKKSNKNSWIGYKDYFLDSINPEYPYFLFATIHIPIRDDMYKILVHRYYNEDEPIDEDDNYREPTCVYVGKIKNKSELNQLLKRLNIINE